MIDIKQIKKDFPLLNTEVNNKPIVYLDTSASAQKPRQVVEKMQQIYFNVYANPHRGTYTIAEAITQEYENARITVQKFIKAKSANEVVFTRSATESINLVAATFGAQNLSVGDEVLISQAEHHANLVPWQQKCLQTGAKLVVFKVTDEGDFDLDDFKNKLSKRTKIVAVSAMSNVLGTIFPLQQIVEDAHKVGALVLVDACQFAVHNRIDVQKLDCDFLAFSAHKTYGPSGVGVLYGKQEILNALPPYQYGGDMVENVTYEQTSFAKSPARFEAGTPAFVQAIGMAEGLKYMQNIGFENIVEHEQKLTRYALKKLQELDGLKIIGTSKNKGGVFCFDYCHIHPQDLAFILNKENVYIRIGHHCAQPIVNRMGYNSLARASFGIYTQTEDIDALVQALLKAKKFLGKNI